MLLDRFCGDMVICDREACKSFFWGYAGGVHDAEFGTDNSVVAAHLSVDCREKMRLCDERDMTFLYQRTIPLMSGTKNSTIS